MSCLAIIGIVGSQIETRKKKIFGWNIYKFEEISLTIKQFR